MRLAGSHLSPEGRGVPNSDVLTVLRALGNKVATKRIYRTKTGDVKVLGYDRAYEFCVTARPINCFADLVGVLSELRCDPFAFVIRGAPRPDINWRCTKRRLRPRGSEPATFDPAARRVLPVDIDHLAAPAATDPAIDPGGAVEYVIGKLPTELHDAECYYQFTSSQSLPGHEDALSLRLWFWLAIAYSDEELKRWAAVANAAERIIDPAIYNAIQPIYTATPIFEAGLIDPLPRRAGVRRGLDEEAVLIIPPADPKRPELASGEGWAPGRGVQAYLAEIGGGQGFREPIRSAVASFIAIHGSKADAEPLKTAIRAAIDGAETGGRPREVIDRYKSELVPRRADRGDSLLSGGEAGNRYATAARRARRS